MSTAPAIHVEEPRRTTPAGELHTFKRRFRPLAELTDSENLLLAEISRRTLTKGPRAGWCVFREHVSHKGPKKQQRRGAGLSEDGSPNSLADALGWRTAKGHTRKLERYLVRLEEKGYIVRSCLGRRGRRCLEQSAKKLREASPELTQEQAVQVARENGARCRGPLVRLSEQAFQGEEPRPKRRSKPGRLSEIAMANSDTVVGNYPPTAPYNPPNQDPAERREPSRRRTGSGQSADRRARGGEGESPPPAHTRIEPTKKIAEELEALARTWAGEELPRWPNREATVAKRIEAGATLEDLRDAVIGTVVTRAREWNRRRDFWAFRDGGADPLVLAAGSGFDSYRELGAQEREAEELERRELEERERTKARRRGECAEGGHEPVKRFDRGGGRWYALCRCGRRGASNDPRLREDLRDMGKLVDEPETPAQAQAQAPEPSEAAWDELAERYDRERQARSIGPPPDARQKLVDLGVLQ